LQSMAGLRELLHAGPRPMSVYGKQWC
jgi:hypothetical protein